MYKLLRFKVKGLKYKILIKFLMFNFVFI